MRTYALYERSRAVLAFLVIFAAIVVIIALVSIATSPLCIAD
jgi:hypothetical protein